MVEVPVTIGVALRYAVLGGGVRATWAARIGTCTMTIPRYLMLRDSEIAHRIVLSACAWAGGG